MGNGSSYHFLKIFWKFYVDHFVAQLIFLVMVVVLIRQVSMKTDILNHRVFQINYSLPYHEFGKSSTHYGHLQCG
jgi:hypothetical protein